jgi:hypothetical protein
MHHSANSGREAAAILTQFDPERQIGGVGTLTAVSYVLTLDTPERFAHSRDVGAFRPDSKPQPLMSK